MQIVESLRHPAVPDLTLNRSIKLNSGLSLIGHGEPLSIAAPDIAPPSGPSIAKSPGDHFPLGGFVAVPENRLGPGLAIRQAKSEVAQCKSS